MVVGSTMHRLGRTFIAPVLILLATVAAAGAAAPLFTLDEDGRTFLYRARPGESPSAVAEMFGISTRDLAAFLAANHIGDPTRVDANFVYRIPNAAARALSERLTTVEAENARLTRDAAGVNAQRDRLTRAADDARAAAAAADTRARRAARLETLWPMLQALLVLLVLALAAALGVASAAIGRQRRAERYARGLALELEEKRKTALAERQESARRILELESRTRTLEAQVGPRLLVGGRT